MKKKIFFASTLLGGCGLYAMSQKEDNARKRSIPRIRTTKPTYTEPESEEYYPIFNDLSKLDLRFLQRFSAF